MVYTEEEEEEDGENRGSADFRIHRYRWFLATLWVFLGRETLEDHSQLPKKAKKCSIGAVVSFSYVWRHRHVRIIPT